MFVFPTLALLFALQRRINRTLTQKYDMHALRILQKLELEVMQEFAESMGCDEDDVPVDLDLLGIFNSPVNERQDKLVSFLIFRFVNLRISLVLVSPRLFLL